MKHIPNIISVCRIVFSIALFFSFNNKLPFIFLYLICGFSDILDGYIARKYKLQSELGARLDSYADLIFFIVIMFTIVIWLGNRIKIFLPCLIAIVVIRCANILIVLFKYGTFAILHTIGNKITGLLIYISPLLYIILQNYTVLWSVCFFAALSAVEESIIHITSKELDLNRKSIFSI